MDANPQRPRRDGALESLNVAMEAMDIAEERSGVAPAKTAFSSVRALLTTIRGSMINDQDYIELGLSCADICQALDRGMSGKRPDEFSQSLGEAINQLTTIVGEIRKKAIEQSRRNAAPPFPRAKNDKKMIATWKSDLNRTLHVFNTELAMNTHVMVTSIHHDMSRILEEIGGQVRSAQTRSAISNTMGSTALHNVPSGESPPPPPRACFGCNELIEKIVHLALKEVPKPIALVGPGGIGKTCIALTVLHDDRIKERFGDNRRFICCDQFPASCAIFLSRLSKAIGAGVENPETLASLRSFLSSREMFLFLDNAESILDPQGTNAWEICTVVEELSNYSNICLGITSRIYTIPPRCERPNIPILSMESACNVFYDIYNNDGWSDIISDLVRQLDFHPLSITLLATVASHNMWDYNRLATEWNAHHTQVLRTGYDKSLAATVELSLTSPTFRELGPDAHDLLGVIAFFPQGVNENNLDWLVPAISNKKNILDKFCVLSLTYRSNGFVTMLAPLRDHLSPKGPGFSPLLHAIKERYLHKLSVDINPGEPGFEEASWILSEDVNVEHLLDIFTSVDADSDEIWQSCAHFMGHLFWHKSRLVVLGPKIEGLPDDHPSKPECLFQLSRLFDSVGNAAEKKRLTIRSLKLWRERGNDLEVAQALRFLSNANWQLCLYEEGISQVKEALGIDGRRGTVLGQAESLLQLAQLLDGDKQLDAAEIAGSQAINLFSNISDQFGICQCHHVLGNVCESKGETEKAISHFEKALGIASPCGWDDQLFWNHYALARLFSDQDRFGDAHYHIELAKSYVVNDPYNLGRAVELQVWFRDKEHRFEEARSEALRPELVSTPGAPDAISQLESIQTCPQTIDPAPEQISHSWT